MAHAAVPSLVWLGGGRGGGRRAPEQVSRVRSTECCSHGPVPIPRGAACPGAACRGVPGPCRNPPPPTQSPGRPGGGRATPAKGVSPTPRHHAEERGVWGGSCLHGCGGFKPGPRCCEPGLPLWLCVSPRGCSGGACLLGGLVPTGNLQIPPVPVQPLNPVPTAALPGQMSGAVPVAGRVSPGRFAFNGQAGGAAHVTAAGRERSGWAGGGAPGAAGRALPVRGMGR